MQDRGETLEHVTVLKQAETVRLDCDRLDMLVSQLGEAAAENVICRALEEIAVRLSHAQRCHREGRLPDMRRSVRSLIAISDQIGMGTLARVAGHVTACIDEGDPVALSATLARLMRIGESCIGEMWDICDLTI